MRGSERVFLGSFFGAGGLTGDDDIANARLAAAAPVLLAACQRAADALECADDDVATLVAKRQAADECRAAIRLALEGQ